MQVKSCKKQLQHLHSSIGELQLARTPLMLGNALTRLKELATMKKLYPSAAAALDGVIRNDMLIASGGFGQIGRAHV